jgi:hypothetical protein
MENIAEAIELCLEEGAVGLEQLKFIGIRDLELAWGV